MTYTVWPLLIFQLKECTLDQSGAYLEIAINISNKKNISDENIPLHMYLPFVDFSAHKLIIIIIKIIKSNFKKSMFTVMMTWDQVLLLIN